MRCDCCDKPLTDYECSLKSVEFGVYMNTCIKCLKGLDIPVVGNAKTLPFEEQENDEDLYDQQTEEMYINNLMYSNPMEEH